MSCDEQSPASLRVFQGLSAVARQVHDDARALPLRLESKAHATFDPVTSADRAVEEVIRAAILKHFPRDGIRGEESGSQNGDARRIWSIDPIDGTSAYICCLPTWGVLVGLIEDGAHIAGMIDLVPVSQLFIAVDGRTFCNGQQVQTSGLTSIPSARLSTTDPFLFGESEVEAFSRLRKAVQMTRYGLDATAYARLAAGHLDLVVESGLKSHDYDAVIPVVRGAGGHVGDWSGGQEFEDGRLVAAATKDLYNAALELLRWPI